jgi:hypothetical protein
MVDLKNGVADGDKEGDRRVLIEDIKKHILLDSYIITFHAHAVMPWLHCAKITCAY